VLTKKLTATTNKRCGFGGSVLY